MHFRLANPGPLCTVIILMLHDVLARSSVWKRVSGQHIISYQAVTRAKSKIACFRQCSLYSPYCSTVGYDVSAGMCFLLPDSDNSTSEVSDMQATVYQKQDDVCAPSNAPTYPQGDITTWHRTLTAMTGEVACHEDYVAGAEEDVAVRCLSTGQWETTGQCRQRVWRQGTVAVSIVYALPIPLTVNRALCFVATPTAHDLIIINLYQDPNAVPLHISVRFASGIVVINSLVYGVWGVQEIPRNPFPMVVGQQFHMKITAISLNQLRIHVDGIEYHTWTKPAGVTVLSAAIGGSVEVHYMDLACPL